MEQMTTIKVSIPVWQRLQSLKQAPGDTLDQVIGRLIDLRDGRPERESAETTRRGSRAS
jgi:macrodomain Ter protein organizer (MatP/YcbG family)